MFLIQLMGNGPRAVAVRELAKDASDDQSLRFVDLGLACSTQARCGIYGHPVAKAEAARRKAIFDLAGLAPVDLSGGALNLQGIHRALHPDLYLFDPPVGQRVDLDAVEIANSKEVGGQLLTAIQTAHTLREDHINETTFNGLHHLSIARSAAVCA
nr:hypothetical protein [Roseovarius nanhaiticus]